MNRRDFLASSMAFLVPPHERVTREIFLRSPGKGTSTYAYAFYTQATGGTLISIEERMSRSDTVDVAYLRNSPDNAPHVECSHRSEDRRKTSGGHVAETFACRLY